MRFFSDSFFVSDGLGLCALRATSPRSVLSFFLFVFCFSWDSFFETCGVSAYQSSADAELMGHSLHTCDRFEPGLLLLTFEH